MTPARGRIAEMHWALIGVVITIGVLGIYNLHSAAAARDASLYLTQLFWFMAGFVFLVGVLVLDYRVTESLAYLAYAVVTLLLLAVLVQGKAAGGARRWLELGPITFQPSELAKLAVVLCLARYFSHRQREDGYSLRALLRPFNPSRPIAVIAALVVFWNKPALMDPIGELARLIRGQLQSAPSVGDLAWFRVVLILLWLAFAALSVLLVVRLERTQALLNPWPPGRRKRVLLGLFGLFAALAVGIGLEWNAPWVRDPFGVLIANLYQAAGSGGVYAELVEGYTLRVILALAAIVYALLSGLWLRAGFDNPVDVLIAPIDLLLIPALLILIEPDLGTAGIIVLIGMTMILVVGVRLRSLLIMGFLSTLIAAVGWFGILKDYQKRRILTFIDPEHDIQGAGWNAVQSMIAVGSGKWWGKGHKGGTQTQLSFLPEQHTDFAFSVWAEEQGFVGCMIVIGLYFLLLIFAFNVARNARDTYGSLLAVGVAAIILWQTLINIGMVIGMFPVVGLTLPLFSYGGSSLVTVLVGIGLLLNVHWRRRAH